ncbi:dermatopontin-like [Clytia hemisphaerica]|uniref:dermatopontin-like n=1 Tax=Clytia hemisphaerica TaxID=252671 RepID=UPI0034D420F3
MTSSLLLNVARLCLFYNLHMSVLGQSESSDLYQSLDFECPLGSHLGYIKSQHWTGDRKWTVECKSGLVSNRNCAWSGYVNGYTQDMNWRCGANRIIVGARSVYSLSYKDRRWTFKCCETMDNVQQGQCTQMVLNGRYKADFSVHIKGKAFVGFSSGYSNTHWDRSWKAILCDFTESTGAIPRRYDSSAAANSHQMSLILKFLIAITVIIARLC